MRYVGDDMIPFDCFFMGFQGYMAIMLKGIPVSDKLFLLRISIFLSCLVGFWESSYDNLSLWGLRVYNCEVLLQFNNFKSIFWG